jgi:palmitoyltransferase
MGPSVAQLVLLFVLCLVNFITLFAVGITFVRTLWGLGGNVTTIESWEIERHEQLLRRSRVLGGYLDGPDGQKVRIKRQEFPYDVGIWSNICQGMGTGNPLSWFWPFAATQRSSGLSFEENGFEDEGVTWPPPDPDRMPRLQRATDPQDPFVYDKAHLSDYEEIQAFKRRQEDDIQRRQTQSQVYRRKPFHVRYANGSEGLSEDTKPDDASSESGEEGWQDEGGNRLRDYGVDEDVEFYDEDDIPLAELISRRKARQD